MTPSSMRSFRALRMSSGVIPTLDWAFSYSSSLKSKLSAACNDLSSIYLKIILLQVEGAITFVPAKLSLSLAIADMLGLLLALF